MNEPLQEMSIEELDQQCQKLGLQINVGRNKLGEVVFGLRSEQL